MKARCSNPACGKLRDILPADNPAYAGLCVPCRKRLSAATKAQRGPASTPRTRGGTVRCTVVVGPPAAGKTTWINQRAQLGDLVVDFDSITRALGGPKCKGWDLPSELVTRAVMEAREAAARIAMRPHTGPHQSFIIHALPTVTVLTDYHRRGATIKVIDPGRAIVMDRIARERPANKAAIADKWYRETLPSYPKHMLT